MRMTSSWCPVDYLVHPVIRTLPVGDDSDVFNTVRWSWDIPPLGMFRYNSFDAVPAISLTMMAVGECSAVMRHMLLWCQFKGYYY